MPESLGLIAQGFASSPVKTSKATCDRLCPIMQIIDSKWNFFGLSRPGLSRLVRRPTGAAWQDMELVAANENHAIAIPRDATSSGKGVGLQ
jgi:hypothetical protein